MKLVSDARNLTSWLVKQTTKKTANEKRGKSFAGHLSFRKNSEEKSASCAKLAVFIEELRSFLRRFSRARETFTRGRSSIRVQPGSRQLKVNQGI
jgi:hypothetical protein